MNETKNRHAAHELPVRGGAYTDIRELIRLRHGSKEIDIVTSAKARHPLSGLLSSNFRGRGIDFAEVRTYEPGDDVRTIDWRVTARTGAPHTKLFQEEKERPVLILVDQSQPMFFGSRVAFKSVIAAEVAALLAWTALTRGDRVGGIVFSETGHREVRPRRNKHSVLRLLQEINDFNQKLKQQTMVTTGNGYLAEALRNLRRVVKHGCAVFVISDFSNLTDDANDEARLHLNQIARNNDLVGIHISDSLERELPRPDVYTITDGSARSKIDTSSKRFREDYHNHFDAHMNAIQREFTRNKSPLFELQTHEPVIESLVQKYNAYARQV
jgi:uncharacterized protein (DUF58 family)